VTGNKTYSTRPFRLIETVTVFVARIIVSWVSSQESSAAVPGVAEQIEAIERVGWRLEFFNEFRHFRFGADKQGTYCMFRRHQW